MEHPILTFRRAKEMSLEAFGALVGVQKAAVSKWQRGKGPSPTLARVIEERTNGELRKEDLRPDIWPPDQKVAA